MSLIPLDDDAREPRHLVERALGWLVAAICCVWVAHRVHLIDWTWDPFPHLSSLVLRDTTANGGDMGAHVYWPKFLAEEWFGRGRVQGWSPHWYGGFPIGQFYFPFPALAIALLDLVLPYNIAFKLVSISGPIALPAAAYVFGSKLRFPWPVPPLFAIVAVRYLFELRIGLNDDPGKAGWTIYGGNLASTMAGEFSFTIALALALFFVAALNVFLERGKRPWLPAVLLAATVTSHIVVAAFAALLGVLLALVHWWRYATTERRGTRGGFVKALVLTVPVAAVGALLTATWSLPLVGAQHFTASMRYEKVLNWGSALFGLESKRDADGLWAASGSIPRPWWLWALVAVAIFAAGWWRRATTLVLATACTIFGTLFVVWPEHHIWNTRFLPFYWLLLGLLAAVGAAELCRLAAYVVIGAGAWVRDGDRLDYLASVAAERAALAAGDLGQAGDFGQAGDLGQASAVEQYVPDHLRADGAAARRFRRLAMSITIGVLALAVGIPSFLWADKNREFVSSWAKWNFEGYEVKRPGPPPDGTDGKGWLEYQRIMSTMGALEPGRALWETGHAEFDNYGGALALELLPYWTDGRIGSMEGLYFESSATMPYHFLTTSEVAKSPSNPVRGLQYGSTADFDRGVRHMAMLGVRYYMAWTPEMQAKADANPDLHLVATVGDVDDRDPKSWKIYELADFALVAPLHNEPVVATVHGGDKAECFGTTPAEPPRYDPTLDDWECAAAPWWMNDALLDQTFADGGPDTWRRVDISELADVEAEPLPAVEVSDVVEAVDSLSFTVDRVGIPVVVRTSYFPNWEVSGAEGPWRISPNLMVVIPTERDVRLTYGLTGWDWAGRLGTLAGLVGLAGLVVWRPRRRSWFRPVPPTPAALDGPATDEPPGHGTGPAAEAMSGGERRAAPLPWPVPDPELSAPPPPFPPDPPALPES